ncbi:hypothetical protein HPP92_014485 [Vanilla planifolia]|uniref:Uncharacterized protein n=1 Tax=Vanilla planifolia TaxID=51239 RepID=A0A835USS3_VANPL|nr:hypothetical protein HPP92_014485 [Vanilla planifolia]
MEVNEIKKQVQQPHEKGAMKPSSLPCGSGNDGTRTNVRGFIQHDADWPSALALTAITMVVPRTMPDGVANRVRSAPMCHSLPLRTPTPLAALKQCIHKSPSSPTCDLYCFCVVSSIFIVRLLF